MSWTENVCVTMGCLSYEMICLQYGESVPVPHLVVGVHWIPCCCRQQLHSDYASDLTRRSLLHAFSSLPSLQYPKYIQLQLDIK